MSEIGSHDCVAADIELADYLTPKSPLSGRQKLKIQ
jgi:hypothetical protein